MDTECDIEVAISFLSQDEGLALEIANRLAPLNVFVYSRRQEELVGQDGIDAFSAAFGKRARVTVILYRKGWGETRFTAAEEHAIKARCFDHDWKHLLTVNMGHDPTPGWMEPWKLWFSYQDFPIDDLIGAIKAKVLERGGQPRRESAVEVGQREAAARQFERETQAFLDSMAGVKEVNTAVDHLFAKLEEDCKTLVASGMGCRVKRQGPLGGEMLMYLQMGGRRLNLNWHPFSNSVRDIEIDARIWSVDRYSGESQDKLADLSVVVSRDRSGIVWRDPNGKRFTSDDYADFVLRELIEAHKRQGDKW